MCAPVAVSPCLSSPRTQRRIHSLRNKCGGEGGGEEHPAAEASSHGGKKNKTYRREAALRTDPCYRFDRSALLECGGRSKT